MFRRNERRRRDNERFQAWEQWYKDQCLMLDEEKNEEGDIKINSEQNIINDENSNSLEHEGGGENGGGVDARSSCINHLTSWAVLPHASVGFACRQRVDLAA